VIFYDPTVYNRHFEGPIRRRVGALFLECLPERTFYDFGVFFGSLGLPF